MESHSNQKKQLVFSSSVVPFQSTNLTMSLYNEDPSRKSSLSSNSTCARVAILSLSSLTQTMSSLRAAGPAQFVYGA